MVEQNPPPITWRWFSVGIRMFVPAMGPECFITAVTVRAMDNDDALHRAKTLFHSTFFDTALGVYVIHGVFADVWHLDALEIPPHRAMLLEQVYMQKKATSGVVSQDTDTPNTGNIVQLFPDKDPPQRSTPRGDPDHDPKVPPTGGGSGDQKP